MPLRQAGDIVGTLNVYADRPRQLGPGGLELLQVLASHAGIALETSAQLERDLLRVRELCDLNETLRDRTRLLQQHAEIHDRFIGVARRGGGTAEIAAELAAATGRAVLVQDTSGQVLASAAHAGVCVVPPDWSRQDEGGRSLPDLLSPAAPVVACPLFPGLLAGPVKVGDELLGVLWLAGERPTEGLHLRAVEQAAVVLGLELLRLRATADAQWQLRGDLVSELISGPQTDAVALFARAGRLGGDLRSPQRVIAVRQAEAGDAVPPRLLRLVQSVVLAQRRPKPLLLADVDPRRKAPLAQRWIGPLRDYDKRKNTELVATLRAFLDSDLDRNSAAAALYVHPNTIGLRLRRIEALLGVRMTSVDHLTTLRTASSTSNVTAPGPPGPELAGPR